MLFRSTTDTPTIIIVVKHNGTPISSASAFLSSSDTSIATIGAERKVTFHKAGTVTFTAKYNGTSAITTTKTVTVTQAVVYNLTINANNNYLLTDTPTLSAVATADSVIDDTATITWNSSDTNIATIDSTGKVTFLAAGTVVFIAHWQERNINQTSQVITITSGKMTCTITGNSNIVAGRGVRYIAHFWNGTTELKDIIAEWTVAIPAGWEEQITYTIGTNNTIYIKTTRNWLSIANKTVALTLQDSNHICTTSITITFSVQ